MAREFRKGKDLIRESAENKGGKRKFTKNIYWKDGDVHTLAWVTAADEIPKVRLHVLVRIPDDSRESGFRYETILCKKDPSMLDESGGVCELCDHVGDEAQEKFVALAVELEPVKEGKRVKSLKVKTDKITRDDGSEVEYPRWGIVMQAASNFFNYFAAYDERNGDIREVAWEIQREGGGGKTKYHPFEVKADLPDLSDVIEQMPQLEDLLDEMGSAEKYALVADLEPGSQPTFGSNGRAQDSGTVPTGDRQSEFAKIRDEVVGNY